MEMAIYFKFKSSKTIESIAIPGNCICVGELKNLIRQKKNMIRSKDYDLLVSNAQTGEDYEDEYAMIPKFSTVVLRRIPGVARPTLTNVPIDDLSMSSTTTVDNDVRATSDIDVKKTNDLVVANSCSNGALSCISLETGGQRGSARMTPTLGYICHRCKVPGHFIQHCPTNGDPSYAITKLKPPTAKSSAKRVSAYPQELYCPVCKELMKDAALTKCCFSSFCNNCIHDYFNTKSACVCGSMKVSEDEIIPNVTIRALISRLLSSKTNSSDKSGTVKIEDSANMHQSAIQDYNSPVSASDLKSNKRMRII